MREDFDEERRRTILNGKARAITEHGQHAILVPFLKFPLATCVSDVKNNYD